MQSAVVKANEDVHRRSFESNVAVALNVDRAAEDVPCAKTNVVSADSLSQNYVFVYPPGYAANGTIPVVRVYFPEFLHSSLAVYVLKRDGAAWHILARKIVTLA